MKYKTGLFSSLFGNAWRISTEQKVLVCKQAKTRHRIPYFDIRGVRIEKGLFWDTVTVTTAGQSLHLEGLSGKVARSLSQDIENRTKETIIEHVLSNEGVLPEVDAQVKKLLHSNRYIAQSDIRNWISQIPDIGQDLAHPYFDADLLPKDTRMNLEAFTEISKPGSPILKQSNERFVQREMKNFAHLFQKLEEFPLPQVRW